MMGRSVHLAAVLLLGLLPAFRASAQTAAVAQPPAQPPLVEGKRALADKHFGGAKAIFAAYFLTHPTDVQGELGLADAQLGLHEYEAAELHYRHVVAAQPLLWAAHKNLVIVEAALGRWDDFDGERAVLRAARQRGDAGLSPRDIDVIDVLNVRGQRWIVRDYFEPLGRTRTRYNFERFSASGRVLAYISLESAEALLQPLGSGAVAVGSAPKNVSKAEPLALDWYDGRAHGTIEKYTTEPSYERVRRDAIRWLQKTRIVSPGTQ